MSGQVVQGSCGTLAIGVALGLIPLPQEPMWHGCTNGSTVPWAASSTMVPCGLLLFSWHWLLSLPGS